MTLIAAMINYYSDLFLSSCHDRILFLFTYAKVEYVSVRTYLSKNRIRTLRILQPWTPGKRAIACVYEDLFLPYQRCYDAPSWGTPCDINEIYTSLKSTFKGLQFCSWQYGSIFIHLAVIASETREMSRNSDRIWLYSSSRSSKVIDLGVNGKPICDFILVINCNLSHICYRFRDIHA